MKTLLFFVTTFILLSGCANLGGQAEANKLAEQKQLAAIVAKAGKSQVFVTEIPSANNFISDQLIVASLKAGTMSSSAQALLKVLQQAPAATVAVTGKSSDVTAATVEVVLKRLSTLPANSQTVLLFVGDAGHTDKLQSAASLSGIKLETLQIP
jgi:hypothetical protein